MAPPWSAPPPGAPTTCFFKPLILCNIKDAKAFIDPALYQMNRLDKGSSSSSSSTFHHGGGSNSSDYNASKWGASLADDASSWLANRSSLSMSGSFPCFIIKYNSDDDFCWAGDKNGFDYGVPPKDKLPPIGYVPSSHAVFEPLSGDSHFLPSLYLLRGWSTGMFFFYNLQ